jgi:hypothetical protein
MIALLLSCQGPAGDSAVPGDTPTTPTTTPLPDAALLRRMSLDLRGTLPGLDELESLESGQSIASLRDAMLTDPRHAERLVMLLSEQWLTLTEEYPLTAEMVGFGPDEEYPFRRAVGQEPLRLLAHVASSDLPWTEAVTADYTLADDRLLQIWPLADLGASPQEGWRLARYTDGRFSGGVMTTNGMMWRYNVALYNRTRAAAISELLLCDDYLSRPISFSSPTLVTEGDLNLATQTEQACLNCHATLDGVASALFGFEFYDFYSLDELSIYHPERERLGEYYLSAPPSWYGTPLDGAAALPAAVAADGRLVDCAVRRFTEGLWRREVAVEDFAALQELEADFVAGGLRVSALLVAITDTDEYRAGEHLADADDISLARIANARILSPAQLADAVEQLTGYRWIFEGFDQLDNDTWGYRVLAGGVSPPSVEEISEDHTVTRDLVIKRLAQAAGRHAVDSGALDASITPDDAAFSDALIALHRRMLSATPDADWLADAEALWRDVAALSDAEQAWASLVSVMIRDPAFWTY